MSNNAIRLSVAHSPRVLPAGRHPVHTSHTRATVANVRGIPAAETILRNVAPIRDVHTPFRPISPVHHLRVLPAGHHPVHTSHTRAPVINVKRTPLAPTIVHHVFTRPTILVRPVYAPPIVTFGLHLDAMALIAQKNRSAHQVAIQRYSLNDFDGSFRKALKISDNNLREPLLTLLSLAYQNNGEPYKAEQVTDCMTDIVQRDLDYQKIVSQKCELHDFTGALATASKINDTCLRAQQIQQIGSKQVAL